jgi:hypothetical protein
MVHDAGSLIQTAADIIIKDIPSESAFVTICLFFHIGSSLGGLN